MIRISRRVSRIAESATLALTARVKTLRQQGVDIAAFGAGEPDFPSPEIAKEAGCDAIERNFTKYTVASGTLELRQAIADRFRLDYGLSFEPSQILVSCGAKHSIYNALQAVCEEGDEVLIQAPYWVSYPDMIRLTGATPVVVPSTPESGFKILEADFRRLITGRTRALILNSPSNPSGAVYSAEQLRPIGELCAERQILVITDDIYSDLIYDGRPFASLPVTVPAALPYSVLINGASKSYSMTGWRIGWAAGPKEVIGAMSRLQGQSTSNPSSISQAAVQAVLQADKREILAPMIEEFDRRRTIMSSRLDALPGFRCRRPEGAFYCFPDVSGFLARTAADGRPYSTDVRLAEAILEEARVALLPGTPFGSPGHLRLSYATSLEEIEKGMERLEAFVARH